MADIQGSGYCQMCQAQRRYSKPKTNHVLHLLLCIPTLGLWLLVWPIIAMKNGSKPLRCTTCGTPMGTSYGPTRTATPVLPPEQRQP